jgi:hypothetical protein
MANTSAPYGFKLYRQNSGLTPPLEYVTLGGTVSIGDPLVWSSGTAVIHTAAADEKIFGIAQANGVSGGQIPFIPVTETQVWVAQATTYTEATHRGVVYELSGTTGAVQVNVAGTTKPIVRIIDKLPPPRPGNETGTYCNVLVMFVADSYGRSGTVTN